MIDNENKNVNSGGPANPFGTLEGISLRQYIACYVMQGVYSSNTQQLQPNMQAIAEFCYAQADIMINAMNNNYIEPFGDLFIKPEPPEPPTPELQPKIEVTNVAT